MLDTTVIDQRKLKIIPLTRAINEYLLYLRNTLNRSEKTIGTRSAALEILLLVDPTMNASDLGPVHVEAALAIGKRPETNAEWDARRARQPRATKRTKGRSQDSLNAAKTTYRSFEAWLKAAQYLSAFSAPTFGVRNTKRGNSEDRRQEERWVIRPDLFAALLVEARARHERDAFVATLGLYGLRRVSEMIDMRIGDVDLDDESLGFRNIKAGGRARRVWYGYSEVAKLEVRRWLAHLVSKHGLLDPDWYLVPRRLTPDEVSFKAGQPLMRPGWPMDPTRPVGYDGLKADMRYALESIGAPMDQHGIGVHTLRHSGSRALEAAGWLQRHVQKMLDHQNEETTRIYLGGPNGDVAMLKGIYGGDKTPPREYTSPQDDRAFLRLVSNDDDVAA